MRDIAAAYERVRDRIDAASERAGRDPRSVTIVAVTKTFTADIVEAARAAGIVDLGENRAQELAQKTVVVGEGVRWHFIGPLQSNKVRLVAGTATLIHSVDRLALATEIDRRARALGIVQDVLVQVNVAGEVTKQGVDPTRALALAEEVGGLPGLRLRGTMTIPPIPADPDDSRPHFVALRDLRDKIAAAVPSATELSMGMSADFEVAVEEGATIVRIGEAIFGPRG